MKYKAQHSRSPVAPTLLTEFSTKMRRRLFEKWMEGKEGWDDAGWEVEDIIIQLRVSLNKGNMIDVANFAMFAWNKQQE